MVSFSEGRMIRRLAHAAVVTGFVGTDVPDWLARRIDAGLGGVCWFAQNVVDEAQAADLRSRTQRLINPARMGRLFKVLGVAAPGQPLPPGFEPAEEPAP